MMNEGSTFKPHNDTPGNTSSDSELLEARDFLSRLDSSEFRVVRRGYEPRLVERHLQDASRHIRHLISTVEDLSQRVEELEVTPPEELEAQQLTAALGDETARVLEAARTAAAERVERAEVERQSILAEADDAATEIIQEGRAQGRQAVNEAREVRERILSDLARKRRKHRTEVKQVRIVRDHMLESLAACQQRLDNLLVAMIEAMPQALLAAERAGLRIASEPENTASQIEAEIEAARLAGIAISPSPGPKSPTTSIGRADTGDSEASDTSTDIGSSEDIGHGQTDLDSSDGENADSADSSNSITEEVFQSQRKSSPASSDLASDPPDTPVSAVLPSTETDGEASVYDIYDIEDEEARNVETSPDLAALWQDINQDIDIDSDSTDEGDQQSETDANTIDTIGVDTVDTSTADIDTVGGASAEDHSDSSEVHSDHDAKTVVTEIAGKANPESATLGLDSSGDSGKSKVDEPQNEFQHDEPQNDEFDQGSSQTVETDRHDRIAEDETEAGEDSRKSESSTDRAKQEQATQTGESSSIKSNVEDIFARLRSITSKFSSDERKPQIKASADETATPDPGGLKAPNGSNDSDIDEFQVETESDDVTAESFEVATPDSTTDVDNLDSGENSESNENREKAIAYTQQAETTSAPTADEVVVNQITRDLRRVIMDDQNDLLDSIRRTGRRAVAARATASSSPYIGALRQPFQQFVSDIDVSIDDLDINAANEAVYATLVEPVKSRLRELAENTGNLEELSVKVRAIYRESRTRRAPLAAEAAVTAAWPDLTTDPLD